MGAGTPPCSDVSDAPGGAGDDRRRSAVVGGSGRAVPRGGIAVRSICALSLILLVGLVVGASPAAAQAPPPTAPLSPDGVRAAWPSEDGRQLWSATRATPATRGVPLLRLLTIRGSVAKIAFSPDGKQIAFENRRASTHGFIAIFDLPSNKILYVDPVFATDTDPVWTRRRPDLPTCARSPASRTSG